MPRSPNKPRVEEYRSASQRQKTIFDVIGLPPGIGPFSAKPTDFVRTRVAAVNDLDARMDISVVRKGLTVVAVVIAGEVSDVERAARSRAQDQVDLVNVAPLKLFPSFES